MKFLVPERAETQRLILRQFQEADWKDLHAYYSSEEATRFTLGRALTERETWRIMCTLSGHWRIRGYGPYAMEDKSNGTVLGLIGFWYPNDWPEPEIKWALAPAYWGQGYASEAARVVQKIGLNYLKHISLISFIHFENTASIQLAKAVGANFEKELPFKGTTWQVYRHPAETTSST